MDRVLYTPHTTRLEHLAARVRLGVHARDDPRRARPGAHRAGRRTPAHRGSAAALMPGFGMMGTMTQNSEKNWTGEVAELLRAGEGFVLSRRRPRLDARLRRRQGCRGRRSRRRRRRSRRAAGAPVRAESQRRIGCRRPARAAGDGLRRQGRHHPPRRRVGRPAGRHADRLQEAHARGARARLPLAGRAARAAARLHRGVRPVALRGRPDRQGALARARRGDRAALRRDQRLREAADRRPAPASSRSCCTSRTTSRATG